MKGSRALLPFLLVLWLPAAPAAGAPGPLVANFSAPVGQSLRAGAASDTFATGAIRAPRRFEMVGFRWAAGGSRDVRAQVRVRRRGRWSPWVAAPASHGGRTRGTEPVWAGGADSFQLRLSRAVRGLRANFVAVGGRVRVPPAVTAQSDGAPPIVKRLVWDPGNSCAPRAAPAYGTVNNAFIHHTVSANEYGPEDSAAMVLAVCRYHRNANGWNDVGYNFLVDRFGRVFEGRAGGVDQAVVGAQAEGWNSTSTGIATLGTFSETGQTQSGLRALGRLVGWKLGIHGVPVRGTVRLRSPGGGTNRYPAGSYATFQRVSGHRDGNATTCPGDALYAQLPTLRDLASRIVADVEPTGDLTAALTPGGPVDYGARLAATGTLVQPAEDAEEETPPSGGAGETPPTGEPVVGATVLLEKLDGSRWVQVGSATTDAVGAWTIPVRANGNRQLRARWAGDATRGETTSEQFELLVRPQLTASAAARRIRAGRTVTVRGRVKPADGPVAIRIARRRGGSYYPPVTAVAPVRRGRFELAIKLSFRGVYRLVATAGPTTTPPIFVRTLP